MGVVLYLVSWLLKRLLFGFSILYTCIILIVQFKFNDLNEYFYQLAISTDQVGNTSCKYLFDALLINKHSVDKFGNVDETISSVLGKNQRTDTLKPLGVLLVWILDKLEKDHSIKSIEEDE